MGSQMSFRNLTTSFALIAFGGINLFGQSLDARVVPLSRTGPNGVLLYAVDKVKSTEINSALNDRRLLGYHPLVVGFSATPDNLEEAGRELSWQQDNSWAFYYMGQRIVSGKSAPSIDELQNAFATANVPNRVVVLRDFLAKNCGGVKDLAQTAPSGASGYNQNGRGFVGSFAPKTLWKRFDTVFSLVQSWFSVLEKI